MRRAGLSPALDYWQHRESCKNYVVLTINDKRVVAFSDGAEEGVLPPQVPMNAELAARGAQMLFQGDAALAESLFAAGIWEFNASEGADVRTSVWNQIFVRTAYALLPPFPQGWHVYEKPVCTCRSFGEQQTCQHLLFADGLGLPGFTPEGRRPLVFEAGPQARRQGRPKGICYKMNLNNVAVRHLVA